MSKSPIEWIRNDDGSRGRTWNPIKARLKRNLAVDTLTGLRIIKAGKTGYHCEIADPSCSGCYAQSFNLRGLPSCGTGLKFTRPNRDRVEIFLEERVLLEPLGWRKPTRVFPCSMTDWAADFVPFEMMERILAMAKMTPQHEYLFLTKRPHRLLEFLAGHWPLDTGHSLPNVRFGFSAGNQEWFDKRIGDMRRIAELGWSTWWSYEPAIGPVILEPATGHRALATLSWVVAGGESGAQARPAHPQWFRDIRDQCAAAGIPFFFKQWGEWAPVALPAGSADLPYGDYDPSSHFGFIREGKKAAGRLLDGVEHSAFPARAEVAGVAR